VGTAVFLLFSRLSRKGANGVKEAKLMASVRQVVYGYFLFLIIVMTMASFVKADSIAAFEDLTLQNESFWNGSDGVGGFVSGSAFFSNSFTDWGGGATSWEGFSYSNITDKTSSGIESQYNAIAGGGQGGTKNYAVGCVGWTSMPIITLNEACIVRGLYVTNNNYAYYSMLNGDAFAKKFGGASGNDPDWLLLTITGKNNNDDVIGKVEFYLADFRFDDNSQDYIIDTWEFVDLTLLGVVKKLEFSLSSSDVGVWGMNTPAYFAIDTIVGSLPSVCDRPYTDVGVNGYIGDDRQHATPTDDDAVTNPIFRGWATNVVSYNPAPGVGSQWCNPNKALGPATGNNLDIVSLGDLEGQQINTSLPSGQITLSFDEPIRDGNGYDFVVFENGIISNWDTASGSITGLMFAELGYVEVSSNGVDFVRFPAVSLTSEPVGPYGTIEISNVYNLAGKHPNANGLCTGTPFDLSEIADDPAVMLGLVDVNNINYVRIVDIPGSGDFYDDAGAHIDPETWPIWDYYTNNHPIYDAWVTWDSGGFDLEAIGVLQEQNYSADINLDGKVDIFDFTLFASAWGSHFGQANWIARCDLAEPKDYIIDALDFAVFAYQWGQVEQWRNK
jgi:hypothetical protein